MSLTELAGGSYYAVIFASDLRADGTPGYGEAAEHMLALAAEQPGYLGVDSARGTDGLGITVSYWRTLEDIRAWRMHAEHAATRDRGRADWYDGYTLRVARIEREYDWNRG